MQTRSIDGIGVQMVYQLLTLGVIKMCIHVNVQTN